MQQWPMQSVYWGSSEVSGSFPAGQIDAGSPVQIPSFSSQRYVSRFGYSSGEAAHPSRKEKAEEKKIALFTLFTMFTNLY